MFEIHINDIYDDISHAKPYLDSVGWYFSIIRVLLIYDSHF